MKSIILAGILSLAPLVASAHGTRAAMTAASITTAAEQFETLGDAVMAKFVGARGVINADKINVTMALNDGTAHKYTCMMMGETVMCTKDP